MSAEAKTPVKKGLFNELNHNRSCTRWGLSTSNKQNKERIGRAMLSPFVQQQKQIPLDNGIFFGSRSLLPPSSSATGSSTRTTMEDDDSGIRVKRLKTDLDHIEPAPPLPHVSKRQPTDAKQATQRQDDERVEHSKAGGKTKKCPYIETIDRKALDFDFEKLCSVSLSKVNVYACLVCGKYFQGRGKSTHAFIHSVSEFHHIFLNLETLKFYCLPDNYEVQDESFEDILYVLKPTFTPQDTERLDKIDKPVEAYDGKLYYPGMVGLNNLRYNDYCNVIFQALSHVPPLRDYFLIESNYTQSRAGDERHCLAQRFGELVRKLWNPRNFKAHVSPHEMLQAIVLTSKKKFEFTRQGDSIVFLAWFLNSLMGPKREKNTIIKRVFEGKIMISSRYMIPNVDSTTSGAEPSLLPAADEVQDVTTFLYLTLDLPTMPLFPKKDEKGRVIKPRISVYELLSKFDGKREHEHRTPKDCAIRRYNIIKLPKHLITFYKRFTKNTFFVEKNTHLVDFPISNLNMTHLLDHELVERQQQQKSCTYDLIANIVHDGEPEAGKGTYRAHILHRGTGKWFELQDLYVTEVQDTTLITLSESYIQIWERKDN